MSATAFFGGATALPEFYRRGHRPRPVALLPPPRRHDPPRPVQLTDDQFTRVVASICSPSAAPTLAEQLHLEKSAGSSIEKFALVWMLRLQVKLQPA